MEPRRLSQLVRGDLDWIVMKALEKDRNRRYETASGFALDIQRYLADEPVTACPPSASYRLRKFARRNRFALTAASMVVFSLSLGTAVSTWQAIRATHAMHDAELARINEASQRSAAERRRIEADEQRAEAVRQRIQADEARKAAVANLQKAREAVDKMLTRVGQEQLANVPHMEPLRKALLEDALQFYQGFFEQKSDDPAIRRGRGMAYARVAAIYRFLGMNAEAETAFGKAFTILEELSAELPHDSELRSALVESHIQHSWLLSTCGTRDEVLQAQRKAVQIAERLVAEFPETSWYRDQLASAYVNLGCSLFDTQSAEAEKLLRRTKAFAAEIGNRAQIANACLPLGHLMFNAGRIQEAENALREACENYGQLVLENPSEAGYRQQLGYSLNLLGDILTTSSRHDEAEKAYRESVVLCEKLCTDFPAVPHYRLLLSGVQTKLVQLLKSLGQTDAAKTGVASQTNVADREAVLNPSRAFKLATYGTAQAALVTERSAWQVSTTAVDGTAYHVQLMQLFDDFSADASYTVRFRARADVPLAMELYAHIHEPDWNGIGLNETVRLTKEWRSYEFSFQAKNPAKVNRITFILGQRTGTVWIADFTVAHTTN
jgi:tetratricopeptide (TPR) repeat protein